MKRLQSVFGVLPERKYKKFLILEVSMSHIYATTDESGTKPVVLPIQKKVSRTIAESNTVEDLVLSVQEKVAQIAYEYVRPLPGFSHEDLFSIAMTKVMSAAVKALSKASFSRSANKSYQRKRAYLLRTARNEM